MFQCLSTGYGVVQCPLKIKSRVTVRFNDPPNLIYLRRKHNNAAAAAAAALYFSFKARMQPIVATSQ